MPRKVNVEGEVDYRSMARRLSYMDKDKYRQPGPGNLRELVWSLRHKIKLALVTGRANSYEDICEAFADRGIQISPITLRRYMEPASKALIQREAPGKIKRKVWDQVAYDRAVVDVCQHLPKDEVPEKVWSRYEEIMERRGRRKGTRSDAFLSDM